ncbi:hypothetical protein BH11BAC2_BH11BAC2_01500 [soil metagenome]
MLLLNSCSYKNSPFTAEVKREKRGEGMEDDVRDRMEWDRQRLSDPKTGKIPARMRERELAFSATLPGGSGNTMSRTSAITSFDFRGPSNVGGRTRAFAIDITNEDVLFAGAVSGGLWRSADNGQSWTRVSSENGYQGVNAVIQDTRVGHTNTWYYLTGEAYGTSASGGSAFYLGNGMYKSIDGGLTWSSITSTVSGTPQTFDNIWDVTWGLAVDSSNAAQDIIYAAVYDGVFRSVNGGTAWTLVKGGGGTGPTQAYFSDVAVSPTGVVYISISSDGAAAQKGIWRSTNGTAYTNILPVNFPVNYDRQVIGIDPNNENTVYFFGPTPGAGKISTDFQGDTLYNSLWKYEYLSGNGSGAGGVWTDLSQNLPGNINVFNGMNTQGGYDLVVKVKPGNANVLFLGGTNIFRSTSAFSDSLNTSVIGGYALGAALPFVEEYPGHHPDQHMIVFRPSNPDIMYSACDGGVSITNDNTATPVSWTEINNGYISAQFYTVTVDHGSTNDIIIGGLQDNGTYYTNSTDPSVPWFHSFDGDGSYCQISDGGAFYYFSKQQGKMTKTSVDANGTVTAYRRFDPIGATGYQFINPFVLDPNNNNIMYLCAGTRMWRNDDLSGIALTNVYDSISTNWTLLPDSVPLAGEEITAIAVSKTPANRLYYGTNKRKIYKIDNANTGLPNATQITGTLFPGTGYVSCIAVNPNDADKVMVVFSNYNVYSIFYTSDAGVTWQKAGGNLEQTSTGSGNGPSCRWASILPVSDGNIYLVGTSTGLYATDTLNGTATVWVKQGADNIGTSVVDMIDTRVSDGLVVVGTHGNGLYSTHITSIQNITSIKNNSYEAIGFDLYPNPVGNELYIKIPEELRTENWKADILNELGQSSKDVTMNPSNGEAMMVNVSGLAKGFYYLRLQSSGKSIARGFVKR